MTNTLKLETSPYLLQHADNPVDWYPWGEAALERARKENKPILLSIGYSACHWCHVMAHESFEDEATAATMNRLYVNIKLDREERPDIDKIYQLAHQLYTGRAGGWPLTAFLTPDDHVPIVVGTYFPREPRHGMPRFLDVLVQVEAYYRRYPEEVRGRGNALRDALGRIDAAGTGAQGLASTPIDRARARLASTYDSEHGGFGAAPKFPRATSLELLLELASDDSSAAAASPPHPRRIVMHTLDRMALGGLYDHLGGGFFRYSTDREWSIPHFEKMLYDNAELLGLYATAFAVTGHDLYADVATGTADWMLREMQSPDGGFFSTLDADSEGQEGKFYVFEPEELDAALDPEESSAAKALFGLTSAANFTDPHTGRRAWHLRVDSAGMPAEPSREQVTQIRRKLRDWRAERTPPARDEKVLAAWNGLAIRGLARAGRCLERRDLADAAEHAVDFVRTKMWTEGRLVAVHKDGRARFPAYLDDYAFLADGLLELLQTRWRSADLDFALELTEAVLAHFTDAGGGFFFTADDQERLLHRPKPLADEAMPSGNGVMFRVLLQLGHLLGEMRYLDAAERGLRAAMPAATEHPDAHAAIVLALRRYIEPPESIVVRASSDELDSWRRVIDAVPSTTRARYLIPLDAGPLPGLLEQRRGRGDGIAYLCRGTECLAPLGEPAALATALQGGD